MDRRRKTKEHRATMLVVAIVLALCLESVGSFGQNLDSEFTFLLPAGRTECFFQTATRNGSMEVEYQVIAGAGMDVDFTIYSPAGSQLVSEFRRSDGVHMLVLRLIGLRPCITRLDSNQGPPHGKPNIYQSAKGESPPAPLADWVEPTEDGDYQICFDNSFSRFSEKMVFFEVIIEGQGGDVGGDDEWAGLEEPEGSLLEYKLEDIRESMDSVHRRLERSLQMQVVLRAFEARDRNLLEDNLWRVSFWSCASLLVMMCVALTQVYTVRKLFDDKRRVCT